MVYAKTRPNIIDIDPSKPMRSINVFVYTNGYVSTFDCCSCDFSYSWAMETFFPSKDACQRIVVENFAQTGRIDAVHGRCSF